MTQNVSIKCRNDGNKVSLVFSFSVMKFSLVISYFSSIFVMSFSQSPCPQKCLHEKYSFKLSMVTDCLLTTWMFDCVKFCFSTDRRNLVQAGRLVLQLSGPIRLQFSELYKNRWLGGFWSFWYGQNVRTYVTPKNICEQSFCSTKDLRKTLGTLLYTDEGSLNGTYSDSKHECTAFSLCRE